MTDSIHVLSDGIFKTHMTKRKVKLLHREILVVNQDGKRTRNGLTDSLSVKILAACSSDSYIENVFECSKLCGCSASEYEGLSCGTVDSTTERDLL